MFWFCYFPPGLIFYFCVVFYTPTKHGQKKTERRDGNFARCNMRQKKTSNSNCDVTHILPNKYDAGYNVKLDIRHQLQYEIGNPVLYMHCALFSKHNSGQSNCHPHPSCVVNRTDVCHHGKMSKLCKKQKSGNGYCETTASLLL